MEELVPGPVFLRQEQAETALPTPFLWATPVPVLSLVAWPMSGVGVVQGSLVAASTGSSYWLRAVQSLVTMTP